MEEYYIAFIYVALAFQILLVVTNLNWDLKTFALRKEIFVKQDLIDLFLG